MNILMLAPQPFFEARGTPISVYQRLRALSTLGHQVDLVTYHVGTDVQMSNLQIHRIPGIPFIKEVKIGPSWAKPLLNLFIFFKAFQLLLTKRYDFIHSHEEAAFLALFFSFLFRIPHVYDMHSSLPRQLENFNFGNWRPLIYLFEVLERQVINTCSTVITIGADLEKLVRKINPLVRLITIENLPLDPSEWQSESTDLVQLKQQLDLHDNNLIVVYTGTFEPYQGLDLLLHSARLVLAQESQVHFVLAGGSPQQIRQWQERAEKLCVANYVHFVGKVTPKEALTYLKLGDILVSPRTAGTSTPLKIYSYLYAGKATIATRLESHLLVLNQEIAYLVEPTQEGLAEGILALLHNPDLRAQLGESARLFAEERHSFSGYLEKVSQVYEIHSRQSSFAGKAAAFLE